MSEPQPDRDPSPAPRASLILGLDASTTALGWAMLETTPLGTFVNPQFKLVGVYSPTHADWRARVDMIALYLDGLFRAHSSRAVAYEIATGSHGNMRTDRMLGAVEWACWRACWERDLEFVEVTASQVKASPFGKRHLEFARGTLEADTKIDMGSWPKDQRGHVADAMGAAWAAWRLHVGIGEG